ncbi:MAG: class B sortase, partial [Eubacteriales bacterium]|nr:class B sortase [Eubacteriales bacterium]
AFEDNNTIIYGHNMLNGTMFSDLLRYRKQSYYDSHPAMKLYTPQGNYDILLFSGYMTTDKSDSYTLNLSDEAFEQYIAEAIAASDFKTDIRPGADSRLVTLSTCDNRTSDKRYVVHGLIREIQ